MQLEERRKCEGYLSHGSLTVIAPQGHYDDSRRGSPSFLSADFYLHDDERPEWDRPLSITADPPAQCWPCGRLMHPRRIVHLTNKANIPLSIMGVLVPEDPTAVLQQLITRISIATPAAEIKAVLERIAPTCPDAVQFNTVSIDGDIDLPVGKGAKGMQLYVFNNDVDDEMFGAVYVDYGSEVTVTGPPLGKEMRERVGAILNK